MGLTKTDKFLLRQNKLALYMKAQAQPARVVILDELLKLNTCLCSEIVERLPFSQSTVSKHSEEAMSAGFIKAKIESAKV